MVDNSFKPPIEKCLGYWYPNWHGETHDQAELELALTECRFGSKPPLQCMFDQPEPCKGKMLIELTSSSSTFITDIERELLWCAAFGQKLVCKESEKSEKRTVKAIFLQWLLTNPEAVKLISTNGIYAEKIIIEGDLNLDSITIPFPLVLKGCFFNGDIKLTDAETRFISLEGSSCNSIVARGIRVKGDFRLDSRLGEKPFEAKHGIDFSGANISDDFDCSRGRFTNARDKAFWAKHIHVGGSLSLIGSYVNGEANLSGAKIGGNLDCSRGVFINWTTETQNEVYALDTSLAEVDGKACFNSFKVIGHVFALEMKIGGDFDCTGGGIDHKTGTCHAISIDRSNIGGSVLLCQNFSAVGQVRLIGTKIAGDLDCSGGKFKFFPNEEKDDNALYASRAEVGSCVFLCESRKPNQPGKDFETNGWINLELTKINHSIKVGKDRGRKNKTSIFSNGGINIENAKITDSLELIEVQFKETKFNLSGRGAKIGRLVVTNGKFEGGNINLESAIIVDSFEWSRVELTKETELNLRGAKIGRLVVTDGEFGGGKINLESAKITGSFEWSRVELTKETELNLRGATVGHLVTLGEEESWPNLCLDGFVYDRIEHQGLLHQGLLDNNYRTHLNWLEKQKIFNPQIYEQLATVLRRNGQDADAKKISIEKEKIRRKPKDLPWWFNPSSLIFNITTGYGYKAYRPLLGAVFFILLGWFIFDKAYDKEIMVPTDKKAFNSYTGPQHSLPSYYPEFMPLVYSFDAFLPIGKLQQQEKWQPYGDMLRRYLYYIHIPFGWLLTTFGIAGLLQTIVRNK